jgi:hypothetical protein
MVVLSACGGASQKPAESAADTSSLEQGSGSGEGAASPSDKSDKSETAASTSSSGDSPSPSKPAATTKAAPAADSPAASPAAAASAVHPTPSATGSIDGKPFAPKIARSTAALQKDGRLLVTVTEGTECGGSPKPGEGTLTLLLEWKDGYKTDLGSLRRATKPGGGEVGFTRGGTLSKSFKPTGRITVVSAPSDANATGKLKVDLQSGDFMLAGDLDVLLCTAAK